MGDLALDFKDLLLGDLAGFFAVFEGVVLRWERETVCLAPLYFDWFFLEPSSSLSNEFFLGEIFAGFAFGSLNFLSELEVFLAAGAA